MLIVSDIWINFINYIFLAKVEKRFVPKMDYSKKIPDTSKTVIVIPALLTNKSDMEDLVKI